MSITPILTSAAPALEPISKKMERSLQTQITSLAANILKMERMLPAELNPNIDDKTPAMRAAENFPIDSLTEMNLEAEYQVKQIELGIEALKDPSSELVAGWEKVRSQFFAVHPKVEITLHHRENDRDITDFERDVVAIETEFASRFAENPTGTYLEDLFPKIQALNEYAPTLQKYAFSAPKFLPVRCADHCVMARDLSKRVSALLTKIVSEIISSSSDEDTIYSSGEIAAFEV